MEKQIIILMIIALSIGLAILFISNPLKLVVKFFINSALAFCLITLANYILKTTGLYLGINLFTLSFTAILGVPGLVCLYILKIIL